MSMLAGTYESLNEGDDQRYVFYENGFVNSTSTRLIQGKTGTVHGPEDICHWADGVDFVKFKLEEQYRFRMVNGDVLLEEDVPEEFKYFGRSPLDLIFSVNLDYLVYIALIKYGKREEVPLEHQVTYKKVKSIKPNSDRL